MAILCSGCGRQLPRIPIRGKLPVLCASCAKLGERALLGGAPQGDEDDMATVDQPPPSSFRAPAGSPASGIPRPRSDLPPASVRASSSGTPSSPRTMPAPPPGAPRPTPSSPPHATHVAPAGHTPLAPAAAAASAPRPRAMPNAIPVAPPTPRIDRAVPRPSAPSDDATMLTTGELEVVSAQDDELVLNTGDFEPVDTKKK